MTSWLLTDKMILALLQNTIVNICHLLEYDILLFLHVAHRLHVLDDASSVINEYISQLFL